MFGNSSRPHSLNAGESETARGGNSTALFYIWFASNVTIGDFALGFIPITMGLSISLSIASFLMGTLLGGALLGIMSVTGSRTGVAQMEQAKGAFGRLGGAVMSGLQWLNTLGWLTVNTILASYAIYYAHVSLAYEVPLAVVIVVVALISFSGYRAIHLFELAMSFVLGALAVFITLHTITSPLISGYHASGNQAVAFGVTLASSFSYIMSWGPYASDYSRNMREESGRSGVFLWSFLGSVVASFWMECVGMLVAIASSDASGNPVLDLARVLGPYAAIGLVAIFLGGLSANSINLYSNTLSLRSLGMKVRRSYLVAIASAVTFALSVVGFAVFYQFYESFLLLLDYWITPWLAIMIVHSFTRVGRDMSNLPVNRWAVLSYILAIAVSVPFMDPGVLFEGPVSRVLGGVDISYYVSFVIAALLYYFTMARYRNSTEYSAAK
ncbi:cytosine permease [Thermogymnomonas acidicola]|uniref:Cytosine permease n=2 Tax=Thermogymnomonas acidicola TaxID=399579 RepID=A0AA37BRP2_9ARCH|nr:cytosine permease [Thermogymnomonas acidicola]GGM75098.1 cytosine permease [Thermogymnomonas acidicola]